MARVEPSFGNPLGLGIREQQVVGYLIAGSLLRQVVVPSQQLKDWANNGLLGRSLIGIAPPRIRQQSLSFGPQRNKPAIRIQTLPRRRLAYAIREKVLRKELPAHSEHFNLIGVRHRRLAYSLLDALLSCIDVKEFAFWRQIAASRPLCYITTHPPHHRSALLSANTATTTTAATTTHHGNPPGVRPPRLRPSRPTLRRSRRLRLRFIILPSRAYAAYPIRAAQTHTTIPAPPFQTCTAPRL